VRNAGKLQGRGDYGFGFFGFFFSRGGAFLFPMPDSLP
jgi:hypothetical protein